MIETSLKKAKQFAKRPRIGEFSTDGSELDWTYCREYFSQKFNERSIGIFFSCEKDDRENISNFILKTEDVLNISLDVPKSKFYHTNLDFAFWIEPSFFWKCCPMRRSFFTVLLRAGLHYNGFNYEDCLFSKKLISTKNATQRFLFGFTEFKDKEAVVEGIGKGWINYFANKNVEFVRESLKSSRVNREFLFGEKILWTN